MGTVGPPKKRKLRDRNGMGKRDQMQKKKVDVAAREEGGEGI